MTVFNVSFLRQRQCSRFIELFSYLEPLDTDDFDGFTEMKMKPSELTNLANQRRRRRHASSNDQANQRRKRALSSYELYDVDPVSLII